jgi:hypothetical protein
VNMRNEGKGSNRRLEKTQVKGGVCREGVWGNGGNSTSCKLYVLASVIPGKVSCTD